MDPGAVRTPWPSETVADSGQAGLSPAICGHQQHPWSCLALPAPRPGSLCLGGARSPWQWAARKPGGAARPSHQLEPLWGQNPGLYKCAKSPIYARSCRPHFGTARAPGAGRPRGLCLVSSLHISVKAKGQALHRVLAQRTSAPLPPASPPLQEVFKSKHGTCVQIHLLNRTEMGL